MKRLLLSVACLVVMMSISVSFVVSETYAEAIAPGENVSLGAGTHTITATIDGKEVTLTIEVPSGATAEVTYETDPDRIVVKITGEGVEVVISGRRFEIATDGELLLDFEKNGWRIGGDVTNLDDAGMLVPFEAAPKIDTVEDSGDIGDEEEKEEEEEEVEEEIKKVKKAKKKKDISPSTP